MPKVTSAEARRHEQEAWVLRRQCLTEAEIAARLGISQPAVSKILARVEDRTLKALTRSVGRVKARQTEQLDWVVAEAARAWALSLEDAESEKTIETIEAAEVEDGDPTTRRERTVKGQSGNPQHLAQLRGALADQRSLWGLDAPAEVEHGGQVKVVVEYTDAPHREGNPTHEQ